MRGGGLDFIRAHDMVCFHLHNHWPTGESDGIAEGMAKELGWPDYMPDPAKPSHFKLPPTTLLGLAKDLSARLNDRTLRVVGNPSLPVSRVAAHWGSSAQIPTIHPLNQPVETGTGGACA